MSESRSAAVIVVSSQVMRGSVGNRAAVFALETLGHRVWSVPTVVMPWHPGHGPSTRLVFDDGDFARAMEDLSRAPWLGEVRAVLTGYFGSKGQPEAVAALIGAVKRANPDALYLCDPVLGDQGGLYIPEQTAKAIRDHLLPIADIATPNRFELEWLTGQTLADTTGTIDAARLLGIERVVVTSAHSMMVGGLGNLLVQAKRCLLAEHRKLDHPPSGTGDLFAAVYLARLLAGDADERALEKATASIFEVISRSARDGAEELELAREAASLHRPMAAVQVRNLLQPRKAVPSSL